MYSSNELDENGKIDALSLFREYISQFISDFITTFIF